MFSTTQLASKPEVIFVIGGPGSGKGTHCERLEHTLGFKHISTGDLIRTLINNKDNAENEEIQTIHDKMQKGELLDDEAITSILAHEMQKYPNVKGFLIDGYPRTLTQLEMFEKNIQVCNKVLFLDANETTMKNRLLERADLLHREDDNEITINKRLVIFNKKTGPVIQFLKTAKNDAFIQIDSSGSIEQTTQLICKALNSTDVASVNVLEFLTHYLRTGNFYDAIETLEKKYKTSDFKVGLPFSPLFYVIQNKDDVRKVLNSKVDAGFQNHNFDVSHGHMLNINALTAFVNGEINPIWQGIHTGLLQSVGNSESIKNLITKHFPTFLKKQPFSLDIAFDTFIENVWCEFMFGKQADVDLFHKMRTKLLETLRFTYYDSRLKNIPFLGTEACRLYGYMKKNTFNEIDNDLKTFLSQSENSLFSRLRDNLLKNKQFPQDQVETALLDNAFVLVLALDFIENAMLETLNIVVKSGLNTTEERKKVYTQGLHNGFLFPFRTRVPQEALALSHTAVSKGTPIYINLLKSGLYHSAGPRTCAGIGVTQWIKDAIWDQLKDIELELISTTYPDDREKMSYSLDVPMSPERHEVSWHYSRDYLQKILPHYEFKGVTEFFDILKIYEKPFLSHYIANTFIHEIRKLNLDPSTLCIATPEVRGIPLAAIVAENLQVPLVIIRKKGKIPGSVVSKTYSNAYADEVIELSTQSDIANKQVIFIDDGIASGGTTIASCDLIKQMGGNIALILAMINHTYKEKVAGLDQYPIKTLFDFGKKAPAIENITAMPINHPEARRTHAFFKMAPIKMTLSSDPENKLLGSGFRLNAAI